MKICFIHNLYQARGGAEKFVANLAAANQRLGGSSAVIATAAIDQARQEIIDNIKVYYLPSRFPLLNTMNWPKKWWWLAGNFYGTGRLRAVRQIIDQEKSDLIITNNLFGLGFVFFSLARLSGVPAVHILHDGQLLHPSGLFFYKKDSKANGWPAKIYQKLTRYCARSAAVVISPSRWLLEWHTQRGFFKHARCQVLPNPWPTSQPRQRTVAKTFNLLYIGQLETHKGVKTLLNAWSALAGDRDIKFTLSVAGRGSLRKLVAEQAGDNFHYLGFLSGESLTKALEQAHCLVVPSLVWENYPTVVAEALATGLPVIASRLGGLAEMLPEACLFTPNNPIALAAKAQEAATHYDKFQPATVSGLSAETYLQKISQWAKT